MPRLRFPLFLAIKFGNKAVKYKWFSIFYIVASFFLLPLAFYGLSLIDTILMEIISGLVLFIILFVILVNYMQEHHEKMLPRILRDWKFLPKPLRTLQTIDFVVQTYMEVSTKCDDKITLIRVDIRFTAAASCGELWPRCLWSATAVRERMRCLGST